ncbi:MAG: hypothetical protein GXP55_05075 [Deltaproteobacteria bacterium]|nr:hypothetical protein [Deltaproteobacteria bacterium]
MVSLEGDPVLTLDVQARLARRGVVTAADPSCPAVTVSLSVCEAGIRMTVVDSMRPTEERVVSDTSVAASVIESWARQDIDAPLLRGPEFESAVAFASAELDLELVELQPRPREPAPSRYFAATTSVGLGVAGDESVWLDSELRACLGFGPLCTGAVIRGRFDLGLSGDSSQFSTERTGLDVLLTAGVPADVGTMELTPSIGAGAGWLHSRSGGDRLRDGAVSRDSAGIRLEVRLDLAIPLATHWAISTALQLLVSPLAHTAPGMDGGTLLAGEPRWSIGAEIGLRYGGP